MTTNGRNAGLAIALVLTMVASIAVVGLVGAAPADELDYEGDTAAPNPYFDVDTLTVARHPVDKGLSHDDMAGVFDDSGDWDGNPEFAVNTTSDTDDGTNVNPYSFKPGHIDDPDFGVFPRTGTNDDGDQDASALDASEWSKSGANSSELTISDTEVADGVDAVRFDTGTSFTAGDIATASYSNWTSELDSDESKRVLQIAMDVDELDSGTVVEINVTDESGDYKQVTVNSSADVSDDGVLATSTGDSKVIQVKLDTLTTNGGGTYNNIEYVNVTVRDGDFDGSMSWLDAESKSKDTLGVKTVDSDGDGTYDETNTTYEAQGAISVNSMESLDSEFDDAVINDVSFPATFEAKMLQGDEGPEGAYQASWESAESFPAYDDVLDVSYRMSLPGYIDLSYSGVDMEMEQGWNDGRYVEFQYAEDVSDDTEFENVSYTDISGNLASIDDTVTIDDTVQTDTDYVVTAEIKMAGDERSNVELTGGAAPPEETESGGFWGFITSIPGMLISLGTGLLGFKWLKG